MATVADAIGESFRRLVLLRDSMSAQAGATSRRLLRAELEPALSGIGITRVGKLTDLDDIGIPVWAAMRPASRSLSVSAGKGITDEAAWTSAVMESCEQAMAEEVGGLISLVATQRGLALRGVRSVALHRQSRCAASHLDPDRELAWVKGLSWQTGETVYAPYELVGMDMLAAAPWDTDLVRMTSVGLASGADLESAIAHGLCELVEDDAMFAGLLPCAGTATDDICFDASGSPAMRETVERLAAAGVEARFAELSGDAGPPVIAAALVPYDHRRSSQAYFSGVACDAVREDAALAALLEAVQCRAIFVSGARDDLFEEDYRKRLTDATQARFGGCRFEAPRAVAGQVSSLASIATSVLRMTGGDFYVFPLGGEAHGFETVRVLADDLVSVHAPEGYARTGRAAATLLNQWVRT